MKYILGILVLGYVGYHNFLKSDVYTSETVVSLASNMKQEVCNNQGMLNDRGISSQQCVSVFDRKFDSCSSSIEPSINSEEELNKAMNSMLNCLTEFS